MSAYAEVKTEFTDGELLIKALEAQGFKPLNCIGKVKNLVGYHGDTRADTADIIIPRAQIGSSSNDVGFKRDATGKYQAIISDYDSTRFNKSWLNKVNVSYQDLWVQQQAKKQGYRAVQVGKKLENGNLKYVFMKA